MSSAVVVTNMISPNWVIINILLLLLLFSVKAVRTYNLLLMIIRITIIVQIIILHSINIVPNLLLNIHMIIISTPLLQPVLSNPTQSPNRNLYSLIDAF